MPVLLEKTDNVHEVELNNPPLPPSSHETVPVGITFVPRPGSLTLTVNVKAFPIFVVAGLGVTVVVVVRKVIVNCVVPKLPVCALSPP